MRASCETRSTGDPPVLINTKEKQTRLTCSTFGLQIESNPHGLRCDGTLFWLQAHRLCRRLPVRLFS